MKDVAVIGLGVMGRNLVLNLVDHGYNVHVFNRTVLKTKNIVELSPRIFGYETLKEFVHALPTVRRIFLMVQAGKAIDEFLCMLDELLDDSDIVIDCGNSSHKDSARRASEHKYNFVGCGMSGGEFGARYGPSMMVGCRKDAYDLIRGVLEDISAKYEGKPCCGWMGEGGAGHFVKIVHNGIEYCEMQLLQEIYNIICFGGRDAGQPCPNEVARRIFEEWCTGRLEGYLVEICGKILRKRSSNGYMIDQILDKTEQKGTGKMCVLAGIEAGVEVNAIAESVFARFMSHQKEKRERFSGMVKDANRSRIPSEACMEKAFYLCKAIFYIQGANLLLSSKSAHGWSYSISQVCEVWRDGCILRCKFLDVLKRLSSADTLETSQEFLSIYNECGESLRTLCRYAVDNDIYCPLLSNCLMWLNGLKMNKKNGSLVQAMRDYFGRHGVVLVTGEHISIDWEP